MVGTGGEGEQGRAPLVVLTLWLVQGVRVTWRENWLVFNNGNSVFLL